jgi:hypothetical protein
MKNAKLQLFGAASRACAILLVLLHSAKAEINEPDNVLYGTISLDGAPVTAARTDVIVEARRLTNGPPLASYRMGANPRFGNHYALAVALESLSPVADPAAFQTGESLVIVVRDASGIRGQATYVLGERGQVQRVDFGSALPDSDGDALPDAWELFHFGNLAQSGGLMAANGSTVLENFVSGADPSSTNGCFKLNIAVSNNVQIVSFLARRAEGAGYEGRSRFYSIEAGNGLSASSWNGMAGFTNVPGNNQTLLFQTTSTNAPAFFRGRVWLQP